MLVDVKNARTNKNIRIICILRWVVKINMDGHRIPRPQWQWLTQYLTDLRQMTTSSASIRTLKTNTPKSELRDDVSLLWYPKPPNSNLQLTHLTSLRRSQETCYFERKVWLMLNDDVWSDVNGWIIYHPMLYHDLRMLIYLLICKMDPVCWRAEHRRGIVRVQR